MNNSEYKAKYLGIKAVAIKGYNCLCEEIEELVNKRLAINPLDYFKELIESKEEEVYAFMEIKGIKPLHITDEDKITIAEDFLTKNIKQQLAYKGRIEIHLDIKDTSQCVEITNGIEYCPYFTLFDSPTNINEFEIKAQQFLELCDPSDEESWQILNLTINNIRKYWEQIEPHNLNPDRRLYHSFIDKPVKPILDEWVKKHSGT